MLDLFYCESYYLLNKRLNLVLSINRICESQLLVELLALA